MVTAAFFGAVTTPVVSADCERSPDTVLRQALQNPQPHETIVVGTVLDTAGVTARLAIEVVLHGEAEPIVTVRDHDVAAIRVGFEPETQYAVVIVRRDDGVLVTSRCQGSYETDAQDTRELVALAPDATFIERDETAVPETTVRLIGALAVVAAIAFAVVVVMRPRRGRFGRPA